MANTTGKQPRRAVPPSEQSGAQTRAKLLDAGGELFAAHGYEGVSLRQVVVKAGVNVAAAHYHFGSKQALFEEVFERAAQPVMERTLSMLAAAKAKSNPATVLEDVVRALIVPSVEAGAGNRARKETHEYGRLRAHLFLEESGFANKLFKKFYARSFEESIEILNVALPHLSGADLAWRYHVLVATLVFTTLPSGRVHPIRKGVYSPQDVNEVIAHLVPLLVSLFSAPPGPSGANSPRAATRGAE